MKKTDIIWGGDHKAVVQLQPHTESIHAGNSVELVYDYALNEYAIVCGSARITIKPANKESENELELVLRGHYTITTVLDFIEKSVCILQIQVFEQRIELGKLASLKIAVTDDVVSRLSDAEQKEAIKALEEKFIYENPKNGEKVIFVKGYGRNQADFSLLSKNKMLHVRKQDDVYVAENLVRYDRSRALWDAVYLIVGKIEFVDSTHNAQISKLTAKEMGKIKPSGTYFDIWNAYQNLETISLLQQAREAGVVKYSSFGYIQKGGGYEYRFTLENEPNVQFSDNELLDCFEKDIVTNADEKPESIRKYKIKTVGEFVSTEGNVCVVFDRTSYKPKNIPSQGFLFKSLTGDFIRFQRCEIARDKILGDKAEIDHLKNIIEDGTTAHNQIGAEKAITNRLKKQFPQYTFNQEQEKAIYNAINTPDLSLVLGPPGTGKTTVIKAIIARFEEWFKKHNDGDVAKVLITSFQHVAVDNAAKGAQNDGLPPNRMGGRKDGKDSSLVYIDTWREEKNTEIKQFIVQDTETSAKSADSLRDAIFAWKEKGKDIQEGINLLKGQLEKNIANLSSDLCNEVQNFIARCDASLSKVPKAKTPEETDDEARCQILLSQRTTKESFADDGVKQARRLKSELEFSGLFEKVDTTVIQNLLDTRGKDEKSFSAYVRLVEELKEKYVKPSLPSRA